MVFNFAVDLSKPRKAVQQSGFGDFRAGGSVAGGSGRQQKPQPDTRDEKQKEAPSKAAQAAAQKAAQAAVVEKESDEEEEEEAPAAPADKDVAVNPEVVAEKGTTKEKTDADENQRFVWDAAKGMLVPEKDLQQEDEDGSEDGSEDEESGDLEAESRNAFLASASTPELIRQAVNVGGSLADATKDKWVLDRTTNLHFKYDSASQKIYCWNGSQGCMFCWKNRGKMDFLWANPSGPSEGEAPPTGPPGTFSSALSASRAASSESTAADSAAGVDSSDMSVPPSDSDITFWVTLIPPQVLVAGGIEDHDLKVEEEMEVSAKAMAAVIGKEGKSIKEIELHTGAKLAALDPGEGEAAHIRHLKMEGTKAQLLAARSAIEQRIVVVLGHKTAEKIRKHNDAQLLERKRAESGSDAARPGVRGLSEFCQGHHLKATLARKLSKLDAMLQRFLIRHFKPKKGKAANVIKGYLVALLKHPQKWRLEALYDDGELDGEICETIPVREGGAVIGAQRSNAEAMQGEADDSEQLIELDVGGSSLDSRQASKIYGDVMPQHCRVLRMGQDPYCMALESHIGTVIDGHKIRQSDGPVPVRDGSVLQVGKFLFYCEVGTAGYLQERRKRLLDGETFWREGNDTLQRAENQAAAGKKAATVVEAEAGAAPESAVAAAEGGDDVQEEDGEESEDEEPLTKLLDADALPEEPAQPEELLQPEDAMSEEAASGVKRKREGDDEDGEAEGPLREPDLEQVEDLPEVGQGA